MEYRLLGRSDISVSVIGFGCGGNARLMVGDDEKLRLSTLRRALDAGINYFDTAPVYGDGRSEHNLGRDLRALGANPVISTKVVVQASDLGDPSSAVMRSVERSLTRLGLGRVDILILHNRVFEQSGGDYGIGAKLTPSDVFGSKGVAAACRQLIDDGVVGVVGFTALGGDISAITRLVHSGAFGVLNVSLNLLNPSAAVRAPASFAEPDYEEIVNLAHAAGIGVMAVQVLARGALTDPASAGRRIANVALAHDDSLPSVAIRYVLNKVGVSTAIIGMSEPSHVDAAVAAIAKGPLSPDVEWALEAAALGSRPDATQLSPQ